MAGSEPEHPPLWDAQPAAPAPGPASPRGGHLSRWGILWGSLVLLLLGSGPLALYILLDPTANPVGPGILAMLTFWPAALGVVIGIAVGVVRGRAIRR